VSGGAGASPCPAKLSGCAAKAGPPATPVPAAYSGGPVEFDRVVPGSGNMMVCQRQIWIGTARAGTVAGI